MEWRKIVEIPFNSDRKRMSLIVEEPNTKKVLLMTKGADVVMMPLMKTN